MLTSLGGGLLGLLDRRLVLTAWLPSLLCWGGIGALIITGAGWQPAARWWLGQPAQFQLTLLVLGLAWITFSAFLAGALIPVFVKIGEGYWPRLPLLSRIRASRLTAHKNQYQDMKASPEKFSWQYVDYPQDEDSVLPTRLGNILKAAEDHALNRYNINSVIIWPRLYLVLPDGVVSAIAAAKAPLDLMAVIGALGVVFTVAGTITALILLPWWAPLACLGGGLLVTWLAYAGAVQAARPYAQLIRAAFDVHRDLLLDAAGLTRPASYAAERRQWKQISRLWQQGTPEDPSLLGYPQEPALAASSPPPAGVRGGDAGNIPADRDITAHPGGSRMSKPPLPEAAAAMLRKPNPAVITAMRPDGQPVSVATWYLWDDGRVLVNMDEGRARLAYLRGDPRVALDVLDESDWYTHLSITGHVDEMREDTDLADIDRLSRQYTGQPYPRRDRRRISAWIAVDGWHGWGTLKDGGQPG